MRIVAGTLGGRRLVAPKGMGVRPTSDRVREALFSILGAIEGLVVLDLFAGSGAFAFEALSRGARKATLVEQARAALAAIDTNRASLAIPAPRIEVIAAPVAAAIDRLLGRGERFDRVFADPPYAGAIEAHQGILASGDRLLAPDGLIVLEHARRDEPPQPPEGLQHTQTRRYGETALSFYRRAGGSE